MVTAKQESIDKIRGLGLGADDYIVKPFDPAELVARVKSHLARYERLTAGRSAHGDVAEDYLIQIGGLKILAKRDVYKRQAYDPRTPLEKIYCVFKENTAQFVLIIPFIYGTLKFIFNVILYQCQKGYYNYFNIDDIFIDFDSKISLRCV